jgi:iron-sulfur cluster assembly protein
MSNFDITGQLKENDSQEVVGLTERAVRQIGRIRDTENIPSDHYLRVGVKGGGCSGMSYTLGFDHKTEHDIEYPVGDVTVIVDKRHAIYLQGTSVDFHDGLDARGFVFNNPVASSTCGCGSSFSA